MIRVALFGTSVVLSKLNFHCYQKMKKTVPQFENHEYEKELEVALGLAHRAASYLEKTLHQTKTITSKDADKAGFWRSTIESQ
jgi:hypothetical protein